MSETPNEPTLDDVITPSEEIHPDHRDHAKTPKHVDDDELDQRTEHEREQAQHDQEPS